MRGAEQATSGAADSATTAAAARGSAQAARRDGGPRRGGAAGVTPPPRRRRGVVLLVLGVLLGVGAFPLLTDLDEAEVTAAEAQAVSVAWQTRARAAAGPSEGWSVERIVPVDGDEAVLSGPPGLAWLQAMGFVGVEGGTGGGPPADGVVRARRVGAAMSLVALASVFWAGMSLGGLRTAGYAGLVCVANPLLIWHGRTATVEPVVAGWVLLGVASALWAVRPLRPSPRLARLMLGWGLSGLALGLGALTGGPWVLVLGALPLLVLGLVCPRRLTHGLGLVAGLALAGLVTIPWAIYVREQDPSAWAQRAVWVWPWATGSGVGSRVWGLVVGPGLWLPVVVVGLVAPWLRGGDEGRRRMLLGWSMGVTGVLVCLAGPGGAGRESGSGSALPAVLLLTLVAGQFVARVAERAARFEPSPMWRWAAIPTAGLVLGASLVGPARMERYLSAATGDQGQAWWVAAGVLTVLALLAARWSVRQSPARCAVVWAAWSVAAAGLVLIPVTREVPPGAGGTVGAEGVGGASGVVERVDAAGEPV
ncbi:MAG: hypothetical protein AAGG38_08630 [Planctomycetota bacterium]